MTEIFGLLDLELTVATGWPPELIRKLKERVMIVGAGTWQDLWRDAGSSALGFGGTTRSADIAERIRKARVIPPELLNRFNSEWVILEPYTAADFEEIVSGLKLPEGVLDPVTAAESGLNFRAVESAVTRHVLSQPEVEEF